MNSRCKIFERLSPSATAPRSTEGPPKLIFSCFDRNLKSKIEQKLLRKFSEISFFSEPAAFPAISFLLFPCFEKISEFLASAISVSFRSWMEINADRFFFVRSEAGDKNSILSGSAEMFRSKNPLKIHPSKMKLNGIGLRLPPADARWTAAFSDSF